MKFHTFLLLCLPVLCAVSCSREPAGDASFLRAVAYYNTQSADDRRIVDLFEESAEAGHPLAKMWLARIQHKGRCGTKAHPELAQAQAEEVMAEVEKLANQGLSNAQFLLGSAYEDGLGVEKNVNLAASWYQKSADSKHPLSLWNLAICYSQGRGVDQNIDRARSLLKEAIALESVGAETLFETIKPGNGLNNLTTVDFRVLPYIDSMHFPKDEFVKEMARQKIISDPEGGKSHDGENGSLYHYFKNDGFGFHTLNDRVFSFNLLNENVDGQGNGIFAGPMLRDLTWKATPDECRALFGPEEGTVESRMGDRYQWIVENYSIEVQYAKNAPEIGIIVTQITERYPERNR